MKGTRLLVLELKTLCESRGEKRGGTIRTVKQFTDSEKRNPEVLSWNEVARSGRAVGEDNQVRVVVRSVAGLLGQCSSLIPKSGTLRY